VTLAHRLFSFDGRLRRRDWWLVSLSLFAFETAIVKGLELLIDGPSLDLMQGNVLSWLFAEAASPRMFAIHAVIMIVLIWPNLAVTTKRAHDRNTSGYWLNGALLVSYATFFLPSDLFERSGRALDAGDLIGGLPLIAETVFGIVMLGTIIVLGFLDGTPGANRYGPSPKTSDEIDVAEVFE
jgi:uncharacterized membrane protein YhaH (DUF805 family)